MASKAELIHKLKSYGIEADESMHPATLTKMVKQAEAGAGTDPSATVSSETPGEAPAPSAPTEAKEGYVKMSDVKSLIAEALAQQRAELNTPPKIKKVTEHTAHVWRFDGKWVVDFKNQNTDPYVKHKIHAYDKFNEQIRQYEPWLELVFHDGSTKAVRLTAYLENRVLVYCPILKRNKIDRSYVIGEVERKKEEGDKLVGTGVMVDQEVTQFEESFEIKTPDGEIFVIPDYAIC